MKISENGNYISEKYSLGRELKRIDLIFGFELETSTVFFMIFKYLNAKYELFSSYSKSILLMINYII